MNILFICDVSGDYGGNFLKSILYLSDKLKQEGKNVCFAFPNDTKSDKWINELKKYPIYFYSRDYKLSEIKSIVTDAKKKYNINIIHCHFVELKGSIVISLSVLMKKIKVVYHWHCQLYESSNFIKRLLFC